MQSMSTSKQLTYLPIWPITTVLIVIILSLLIWLIAHLMSMSILTSFPLLLISGSLLSSSSSLTSMLLFSSGSTPSTQPFSLHLKWVQFTLFTLVLQVSQLILFQLRLWQPIQKNQKMTIWTKRNPQFLKVCSTTLRRRVKVTQILSDNW